MYKVPSGNSSIGLKLSLAFDRTNEGRKNEVEGSYSLSKENFKATAAAETDLSRSSLERSFTFQTNTTNYASIGIQLENNNPKSVFLFAPSNVVDNGRFVVLRNDKSELYGDEIETTGCVLPFQTIRDKAGLESRNKKQIKSKPAFTETRPERHETQKVFMQQMQASIPVYVIRKPSTVGKLSVLGLLACLFLIFVRKIMSFLETKKLDKKLLYP